MPLPTGEPSSLGGVATALTSSGHYRCRGCLDGPENPAEASPPSLPITPIVVAGVPRPLGVSLRPDSATGAASHVRVPLVTSATAAAAPAAAATKDAPLLHPYEWFVGRAAVDDSSAVGALPVVLSLEVRMCRPSMLHVCVALL